MKRPVTYSYVFSPVAGTLDLHSIPSFNVAKLFAVLDLNSGIILYAAGTPGLGATVSNSPYSGTNNLLTLQASLIACSANDTLMIIYDDGDIPAAAQIVTLSQAGALVTSSNRLPIEVDAQSSGLAQDSSLVTSNATLGTIGLTPPTLPGSSTGILGLLRLMQSTTNLAASTSLNVTSGPTVLKATAGRLAKIVVNVAGTGAGSAYDAATGGAAAATNLICNIPATANAVVSLDWPFSSGLVVTPGTGQTLSISYT